jgi:hypothetical protein
MRAFLKAAKKAAMLSAKHRPAVALGKRGGKRRRVKLSAERKRWVINRRPKRAGRALYIRPRQGAARQIVGLAP